MKPTIARAAIASQLAYFGVKQFTAYGFTDVMKVEHEGGSEAYIVEDEDTIFVVFAGTNEANDLLTDIRFQKATAFSDLQLHRGFWEAWRDISDQVAGELMQRNLIMSYDEEMTQKQVVFCGHSLGGALAVIAAATLNPTYCVTFGAPPVGGQKFKDRCDASVTVYLRYILNRDPVPRLLKWHPKYKHTGGLIFIDGFGQHHVNPSFWKMLWHRLPFVYRLKDHSIEAYCVAGGFKRGIIL